MATPIIIGNDPLTFETLVDAYFAAASYSDAAPELRDYYALKRAILESLFECSLEEPSARSAARFREERDECMVTSIARRCLQDCARLYGPFGVYLEGGPGPLELALRDGHKRQLEELFASVEARYRAIFRDALAARFPSAPSKSFPAVVLHERGLPAREPDPDDYW